MAKDNMFMGIAAVGGAGLGYALSKMMGTKAPGSIEETVGHLYVWSNAVSGWLQKRLLWVYTSFNDVKAAQYAWYFQEGERVNVEVLMAVAVLSDGRRTFECNLQAGVGATVYYDELPKVSLTAMSAYQIFIV
jgi:hypothetical protein